MAMLGVLVSVVVLPKFAESSRAASNRHQAVLASSAREVIDELQRERGLSVWALAGGGRAATERLAAVRLEADARRAELTSFLRSLPPAQQAAPRVAAALAAVEGVDAVRVSVDAAHIGRDAAFDDYTARVDTLVAFTSVLATQTTDARLVRDGVAATEFLLAKEELAQRAAVVVGRLEAGALSLDDFARIDAHDASARAHTDTFRRSATVAKLARVDAADRSPAATLARAVTDMVRAAARAEVEPSVGAEAWWTAMTGELDVLDGVDDANFEAYVTSADDIADARRSEATGYLVVGVLGVLGTAFAAVAVGRSLVRGLSSVAGQARSIAFEQLGDVLTTLRSPTPAALARALPQVTVRSRDEVGTIARAFNAVLRAAVETSIDHAERRSRTVTDMLVNLGRRNQHLIDRQLEIMDELEAAEDDPEVLERLFRVDHMITRMRRNAENLVVLAGHRQARAPINPVSLTDVLRAATSEVPDMRRVKLEAPAPSADRILAGPRAVDASHLLAELLENAVSYSSPASSVVLRTEPTANGLRVWVIDSGVGMDDEELQAANRHIANPPEVDALATDRVGFQVVGRLARNLGAQVTLQANPGGGVAACVQLGTELFEPEDEAASAPVGPPPAQAQAPAQTPAPAGAPAPVAVDVAVALAVDAGIAEAPLRLAPPPPPPPVRPVAAPPGAPLTVAPAPVGLAQPGMPAPSAPTPVGLARPGMPAPTAPALPAAAGPVPPMPVIRGAGGPAPIVAAVLPAPVAAGPAVASAGTTGLPGRANELTADGLVKRAPGAAFTANGRVAAAEAGAFRRLPVPEGLAEAGDAAVDRFQALSRFQRAVAHGRGAGATDDDGPSAGPAARAAGAPEGEGSR
jgi:signal transduction histidine kinase